jgi:apolipoprotein N-acyltransferase
MEFVSKSKGALPALLVFASTVMLVWFGNGLNPSWPLLWFAPLPVLWFALRNSWSTTAIVAASSYLVGCLNLWHYFRVLSPYVWAAFFCSAALAFVLGVLLFRALVNRGGTWSALLALPSVWVCFEFIRNYLLPHGTAGSLAYTQLHCLPILQLASLTGPWGISFLLLLFPAVLALGVHLRRTAPKRSLRVLGVGLGAVAGVLIFGVVRLEWPQGQQRVTVGLIASDEPGNGNMAPAGADTQRLLNDYAIRVEELAARGAQVIVLPEKLGTLFGQDTTAADAIFQSLADQTKATIVVGVVRLAPQLKSNQARVYAPEAGVLSYDKHHLLPPFESMFTPGTTRTLLSRPSGTWGVAICKDMDFTPLSRSYGKSNVGLMLVPGWDFDLDRSWHGHMAVMRGVEDGFSMARAAKGGYLTVSDDRGRVLAETQSDSAPFATLLAEVPVAHDETLYLLMGDWFAWLAIATLAFAILQLFRLNR